VAQDTTSRVAEDIAAQAQRAVGLMLTPLVLPAKRTGQRIHKRTNKLCNLYNYYASMSSLLNEALAKCNGGSLLMIFRTNESAPARASLL
jgi:hypothetical protein